MVVKLNSLGFISSKIVLSVVITLILSGLIILGAFLYRNIATNSLERISSEKPYRSGKVLTLPFNLKSSSIKVPTLLFRLSGKVIKIEPHPEASSSAWTIQPEDPSDPQEVLSIPWDRAVSYQNQQNLKDQPRPSIQDVKTGFLVELLMSFDINSNQKTVGQVLVKNP